MPIPQTIKDLANKVRTAIYGTDVRESIAKSMEVTGDTADAAKKTADDQLARVDRLIRENPQPSEVVDARGGEPLLKYRLDKTDQKITQNYDQVTSKLAEMSQQKADQNDLDNTNQTVATNQIEMSKEMQRLRDRVHPNIVALENAVFSWWTYPLALQYKGFRDQTYFGWTDNAGNTGIASKNHVTGELARKTLKTEMADDHNAIAITIKDGYVYCAYANHNTDNFIRIRKSRNVEDIESFETEKALPCNTGSTTSYAQLFNINGVLYLFYRLTWRTTVRYAWAFRTSDDGVNWSEEKILIDGLSNQYYIRVVEHPSVPLGQFKVVLIGHPIASSDHHIRYCYIDSLKNGSTAGRIRSGGADIGNLNGTNLPLTYDKFEIVKNVSTGTSRLFDIAKAAITTIAYATFTNPDDAVYKVLRYDSASQTYKESTVCQGGKPIEIPAGNNYYFGGMWFKDGKEDEVFVTREDNGVWYIERYTTANFNTWTKAETIKQSTTDKLFRPLSVIGSGRLLWCKGKYTNYENFNVDIDCIK